MPCTFILSTRTCSCILLYDTDLKQGSDVHVEAQVGKPCSDDFGTSVMTVLPHFCHQQSRVSALLVLKFCNSDIKRKKNKKKKNLMLLNQSSDKHVHDGCKDAVYLL